MLALDRNFASALSSLGRCKTYIGPVDDAILAQERAIRLSPRDRALCNWYFRIGEAHLLQSRVDQAIDWLEKARSGTPALWYVHAWLAAAYAHKGDLKHARAELAAAMTLQGSGLERGIAHIAERFVDPRNQGLFRDDHSRGYTPRWLAGSVNSGPRRLHERRPTDGNSISCGGSDGAPSAAVRREGAIAIGATAVAALALGAAAISALAIGRLAIGQLGLGRAKVRRGQVGDLEIARLTIRELTIERVR